MSDQFELLKNKYKYNVQGEALFINAGNKALRLEVPDIGKEFTAGVYIGKDPEGTLYYNHADSFDPRTVKFQVTRYVNPSDKKVCAWIKFYTDSIDDCHAEFLAYDPEGTVQACNMDGWETTGDWKNLEIGSATASVRKYDDTKTMTISVGPIKKKATITDSNNVLSGESVDVHGNLWFKDINTVSTGAYASYNNDRIVFYQSSWSSTDFTAYFIPFESSSNTLGVTAAKTTEFSGITWSNT
ncbi:hypothetical protein M407DRAFT_185604 [Tulasnella calospora MUT 4182]|uniref:Uncharacterized protein n=1 Tax=Tulasnella calospora MUT 4182 TaxID=1051891 RepID=A0A0C3M2W4_9AGAM|nr:hypothetical protein M407DRAFT_185604 [Tulasnella calospora MUT 4182]